MCTGEHPRLCGSLDHGGLFQPAEARVQRGITERHGALAPNRRRLDPCRSRATVGGPSGAYWQMQSDQFCTGSSILTDV